MKKKIKCSATPRNLVGIISRNSKDIKLQRNNEYRRIGINEKVPVHMIESVNRHCSLLFGTPITMLAARNVFTSRRSWGATCERRSRIASSRYVQLSDINNKLRLLISDIIVEI